MDFQQLILQKQTRWKRAIYAMVALLVILSSIYLMVGDLFISPLESLSPLQEKLLVDLRLPRLLAAIAIGSALAVSGASLQVLLGNVLAEPGVLGISGGASLAMVIVLFFLPFAPTPELFMIAAVIGSLCFTIILVSMVKMMRLTTTKL
ncbi:MAG: iron chelate uptake ABC transporter family permease subunit, partial [Vibrio gallaecicus]